MRAEERIEMDQQTLERVRKAIDDFGGLIKDYREKEALTLDSLASRIDCSASYIFRAERGSKIVPIHMRVRILEKGLNWKASEIECFLVETVREYEQKNR
ncbi:helix-turn-helix domain-containing protein [Lederbergia citrea]|uniref:Helix-turn-helix domain-containing protein n=1 Tax=Lederbergia citrea TaxID=2833581 RepID=A0A942UNB9_9BACI|nr:helix-turn-helix transcriptional regulator [Lederbergia citrea]MBS4221868.1 helix-turn-helix domain-containing protein [Lederbergia citrea]